MEENHNEGILSLAHNHNSNTNDYHFNQDNFNSETSFSSPIHSDSEHSISQIIQSQINHSPIIVPKRNYQEIDEDEAAHHYEGQKKLKVDEHKSIVASSTAPHIESKEFSELNNAQRSVQIRLLVPTRASALIIGKGGVTIRQMREASHSHIDLDENNKDMHLIRRVLHIVGTIQQATAATQLVAEKLAESDALAAAAGGTALAPSPAAEKSSVTILVANAAVGAIIGKSGAKISESRHLTQCVIKVSDKVLENTDEKTVTLSGNKDQINKALVIIINQLGSTQLEHNAITKQPYQPKADQTNFTTATATAPSADSANPSNPSSVIASLSANMMQLQQSASAYYNNPLLQLQLQQMQMQLISLQHMQMNTANNTTISNPSVMPANLNTIKPNNPVCVSTNSLNPPPAVQTQFLDSFSAPRTALSPSTHNSTAAANTPVTLTIPAAAASALIGRGGSVISSIRTQSKAFVKISGHDNNSNERVVSLTGTKEQVDLATKLVMQVVNTHATPLSNANINNLNPLASPYQSLAHMNPAMNHVNPLLYP
jgi:ribosomal protein S3